MIDIDYENRYVYNITCERELQEEVVKFLNTTDLMFSCSHTDGMLNTPERRNEARMMGYRKGLPDIIIYTPCSNFNGLALEIKAPWGTGELKEHQEEILNEFSDKNNYYVLVSNNLVKIVETITIYRLNSLMTIS